MKRFILVLALLQYIPITLAIEIKCPDKVNSVEFYANPPAGWITYKRQGLAVQQKSETPGIFRSVSPHDGSPFEVLGDLIPDNDGSREKQGFWLWNLKGLTSVYAGCEYTGTNVILIKKIEGEIISSCRVAVTGKKRNQLSCR